jgi:DNA-binding NtrC family response regulator
MPMQIQQPGKKVFVVDDTIAIALMLREFLEIKGFIVTVFENPVAAFESFLNNPADIVITDYCMPDMNGFELLETIRDLYPGIKGIIMTGEMKLAAGLPMKYPIVDKSDTLLDRIGELLKGW